jgi:hypothetical protein
MPPAEAVPVEESFEMVTPVIAKIRKATEVHKNTLYDLEPAVITSLFGFNVNSSE